MSLQVEEQENGRPLWEAIMREAVKPLGLSQLESLYGSPLKKENIQFAHRMLSNPLRNYVIKKIKAPLQKVIILVGKRLPALTRENTIYRNTHNLMDIEDKFFEYFNNGSKEEMFRCAWKMFKAECEHDRAYRYPWEWFVEELIKKVLSGEWEPRLEGWPEPKYWKEPQPYGGKHSIVYKLQSHRREILRIIGEE